MIVYRDGMHVGADADRVAIAFFGRGSRGAEFTFKLGGTTEIVRVDSGDLTAFFTALRAVLRMIHQDQEKTC